MEYIRQSMTFEIGGPTVLSLGKFDGLHRGHELLLAYMAEKQLSLHLTSLRGNGYRTFRLRYSLRERKRRRFLRKLGLIM